MDDPSSPLIAQARPRDIENLVARRAALTIGRMAEEAFGERIEPARHLVGSDIAQGIRPI